MSLHPELKTRLETHYATQIDGDVQLKQDALLVLFDTGLALEVRMRNALEYSLQWSWGDAELRIDTAPLHRELPSFPQHLHDAEGQLREDRVTVPGREPWGNLQRLVDRLLMDPLLEADR